MRHFLYKAIHFTLFLGICITAEEIHDMAVKIPGGEGIAMRIALETNFIYLGVVGNLQDIYHFQRRSNSTRHKRSIQLHTHKLRSHKQVEWVENQVSLKREKRDFVKVDNHKKDIQRDNIYLQKRKIFSMFNDPKWPEEWYLYDSRFENQNKKFDMRVVPVWQMNITGNGVKLTIIDDGIEHTHPDLINNYDPMCSTDLNDNDSDPMPNTNPGTSNEHGTRCASEISMSANNNICGVGIAYNSKIGGIRILDGRVNDLIEAKSIGFNNNYIDIYSASWGPTDDGKTMEKPGVLHEAALINGVQKGRQGKGSIYVWAAGNGGYYNDSCSFDGYVSSIYVISVNSVSSNNESPEFVEKCPSTMCATYSTNFRTKSKLVAADIHGKCTNAHSGTSASAPYAAGIFALALEMNPNLTWRDIKHLVAWTSRVDGLENSIGWQKNHAGFWVNEKFGFGILDAEAMVNHAKSWITVPKFENCKVISKDRGKVEGSKIVVFDGTECSKKITFIENVVVHMSLKHNNRGLLSIILKSPHGMNTTLLPTRSLDNSAKGLVDWPMNSAHNWGESPKGKWTIYIENKVVPNKTIDAFLESVDIQFFGTEDLPNHVKYSPNNQRIYNQINGDFVDEYRRKPI